MTLAGKTFRAVARRFGWMALGVGVGGALFGSEHLAVFFRRTANVLDRAGESAGRWVDIIAKYPETAVLVATVFAIAMFHLFTFLWRARQLRRLRPPPAGMWFPSPAVTAPITTSILLKRRGELGAREIWYKFASRPRKPVMRRRVI